MDDVYYKLLTDEERGITNYPGTTLALAFLYNNKLYCIHCGDSRIVALGKDKKIIYASADHKPDRPSERKRIENAGGEVREVKNNDGKILGYKVGSLAISRSLGNYTAKHIIDDAEVKVIPASLVHSVIIASDGLWDNFDKKAQQKKNLPLNHFKIF